MRTAIPADFTRIGYQNGQIPECALASVPNQPTAKLHPQAAERMGKLLEAAARANINFTISSAYRDYKNQLNAKRVQGRGAATPGTSMHGWGTTIDVAELYRAADARAVEVNRTLPPNQKVDRFTPSVHAWVRENNPIYRWLATNAPRYGWVNPEWAKDAVGIAECWHWEYQAWPTLPNGVQPSTVPATTSRCGPDVPKPVSPTRTPTGTRPAPDPSSVTPFIGSLESFHPRIQYELTRRRISSETANSYMPFFKLTSLVNVLRNNLQGATQELADVSLGPKLDKEKFYAWCPTLGIHGEDTISFEDIYTPQSNRSIVAYATANVNTASDEFKAGRVPIVVEESSASNTDQRNIPIPGVTEINLEKGTAGPMGVRGGLMKADIKIAAYSVGQVDVLLRYFLRPGTRVVMEFGRKSSNPNESPIVRYNWNKPADDISQEFTELILNPEKQQQFIKDYIYASNGNYEVYLGYVVKFDLKYNKNNVYEISLTVHSVQQFELPTKHTGVKSLCADSVDKCSAMDIFEYFSEETAWKEKTFSKLMSFVTTNSTDANYEWKDDFIEIRNSNSESSSGAGSTEAGLKESEYFVSWRFFVDKILNDKDLGIISLMPDTATKTFAQLGLLRPTKPINEQIKIRPSRLEMAPLIEPIKPLEDDTLDNNLIANEVGYHSALRSTDPNIMVIWNAEAQSKLTESEKSNFATLIAAAEAANVGQTPSGQQTFNNNGTIAAFITGSGVGSFRQSDSRSGVGYLTDGVWLNTVAIKQAFTSADTVSTAISSLLTMMNAATEGYWNLQLYSSERPVAGMYVIDMGLSKKLTAMKKPVTNVNQLPWIDNEENESTNVLSSVTGVNITRYQSSAKNPDKPAYIYMFNRGTKLFNDGELGSDLLDLNVEFNLPQVIAVQAIAGIGGPAQKSTLQSLDIPQLEKISLIKNLFASCDDSVSEICKDDKICDDKDLQTLQERLTAADIAVKKGERLERDIISAGGSLGGLLAPLYDRFGRNRSTNPEVQARTRIQTEIANAKVQRVYGNLMVIDTVRELASLGTTLNFIEFNPGAMMRKLNIDSTTADEFGGTYATPNAHAFNSSNLTKTIVNVTTPGIGGISLFQSFLVDRVPSILERGFYVVTKITHKFSVSNGWITTIEGRFRFRPIGENSGTVTPCQSSGVGDPALEQGRDIAPGVRGTIQ